MVSKRTDDHTYLGKVILAPDGGVGDKIFDHGTKYVDLELDYNLQTRVSIICRKMLSKLDLI